MRLTRRRQIARSQVPTLSERSLEPILYCLPGDLVRSSLLCGRTEEPQGPHRSLVRRSRRPPIEQQGKGFNFDHSYRLNGGLRVGTILGESPRCCLQRRGRGYHGHHHTHDRSFWRVLVLPAVGCHDPHAQGRPARRYARSFLCLRQGRGYKVRRHPAPVETLAAIRAAIEEAGVNLIASDVRLLRAAAPNGGND
jgi:hypothetical protein